MSTLLFKIILLFILGFTFSFCADTFPCLVPGCEECSSMWQCTKCIEDIPGWNPSFGCPGPQNCSVANCRVCSQNDASVCQQCNAGYSLFQNSCSVATFRAFFNAFMRDPNIPPNCLNNSRNLCYQCNPGYVLTIDYQCTPGSLENVTAPSNCFQYTTAGICRVCAPNYLLNEKSICIPTELCYFGMTYQDGIFCRSMPSFYLTPLTSMPFQANGFVNDTPISIRVGMTNPGIFTPDSFQFGWTVTGYYDNFSSSVIDSGINPNMDLDLVLSQTNITVQNGSTKSIAQFSKLIFNVFVFCQWGDFSCLTKFKPGANSTLRINLRMKPTGGSFSVSPQCIQANSQINVTVSNWVSGVVASKSPNHLNFALQFGVFEPNITDFQNIYSLSSPTDSQTVSLTLPNTTDTEFALTLIVWDSLGQSTILTKQVIICSNLIIENLQTAISLNSDFFGRQQHQQQNLLAAARTALQNLTQDDEYLNLTPAELATVVELITSNIFHSEMLAFQVYTSAVNSNLTKIGSINNLTAVCSLQCFNGGTCTISFGTQFCICESGFKGYMCEYPEDIFSGLQLLATTALNATISDSSSKLANFAGYLQRMNSLPDLISDNISAILINASQIYYSSTNSLSDLNILASSLRWCLTTYTSEYLRSLNENNTDAANKITNTIKGCDQALKNVMKWIAQLQETNLKEFNGIASLAGTNMRYGVLTMNSNTTLSVSDPTLNFTADLPPAVFNMTPSLASLKVIYTSTVDNSYLFSKQSVNNNIVSSIISISFVDSSTGEVLSVQGLTEPILLTFPIPPASQLHSAVSYVMANRDKFPQSLATIFSNSTGCQYWDEDLEQWSSKGLTLVSIDQTSFTCASTHATDFVGVFLDTGLVCNNDLHDLDDYYTAWQQLITTPLGANKGIWLVVPFAISYIILLGISCIVDNRKVPKLERQQILNDITDKKSLRKKRKYGPRENNVSRRAYEVRHFSQTTRSRPNSRIAPVPNNQSSVELSNVQESRAEVQSSAVGQQQISPETVNQGITNQQPQTQNNNSSIDINTSINNLFESREPVRNNFVVEQENDTQVNVPRSSFSDIVLRIHRDSTPPVRLGFFQYWGEDLLEHHVAFNCITKTSRISPRHARITLLYSSLLLNFTFDVVFFINPPHRDDSWAGIWHGFRALFLSSFLAVLCSCPLVLLISVLLKVPKSTADRLRRVSPEEFNLELKAISKKMRRRYAILYILIGILFGLCIFYILLFCARVGPNTSNAWLISCVMSIIIDQFGFELVPGCIGALLHVIARNYTVSRLIYETEVLIALVRSYKTLNGY